MTFMNKEATIFLFIKYTVFGLTIIRECFEENYRSITNSEH